MAVHKQIINMYGKMMFLLVVLVAIATTVSGDYFTYMYCICCQLPIS
jgi:hypothetical protein